MDRWNRKPYFLVGILLALSINVEPLFLRDGGVVWELYLSTIFELDYFLEEKQFFFAIKQLFVVFVCCLFYGTKIRKNYTIYTMLRLKKKVPWLMKQYMVLGLDAWLFFGMYALFSWLICCFSCWTIPTAEDICILLVSIFSFAYMGFIAVCISNVLAFYLKKKNAVLFSYLIMVIAAFLSMWISDFLGEYPVLSYVNPITSMSLAESISQGIFLLELY